MSSPSVSVARVVPQQEEVKKVLSSLFGKPVVVSRSAVLVRPPDEPFTAALFTHQTGKVGAVAIADLPLTAYAGAGLTMFPSAAAENQIECGAVDEMVFENFREIMNVCAGLFNAPTAVHVKLTQLLRLPREKLAPEVEAFVKKPGARLDLTIQIPNYGSGRLSFLLA
jgi:hypothetical protein